MVTELAKPDETKKKEEPKKEEPKKEEPVAPTPKPTEKQDNNSKHTLDPATIKGVAMAIWNDSRAAWYNGVTRRSRIEEKFGAGAYEKI